jgi:hypothetical protein
MNCRNLLAFLGLDPIAGAGARAAHVARQAGRIADLSSDLINVVPVRLKQCPGVHPSHRWTYDQANPTTVLSDNGRHAPARTNATISVRVMPLNPALGTYRVPAS